MKNGAYKSIGWVWGLLLGVTAANYPLPGLDLSIGTVLFPIIAVPIVGVSVYWTKGYGINIYVIKSLFVYSIFIITSLISTFLNTGGLYFYQSLVTLPFIVPLTYAVSRCHRVCYKSILDGFISLVFIGTIITLVQGNLYERAFGVTSNPNTTSMVIALGSLLSLYRLLNSRHKKWYSFITILMVLAIFETASRSGFIVTAFMIAAICIIERKIVYFSIISMISIPTAIVYANSTYQLSRVRAAFEVLQTGNSQLPGSRSVIGRWEALVSSINLYLENPIFGVGFEQSRELINQSSRVVSYGAHNGYGVLLAETGTLGGLLFFTSISLLIYPLLMYRSELQRSPEVKSNWLVIGFLGILVFGLTARIFIGKTFWVWLALSVAALVTTTTTKATG